MHIARGLYYSSYREPRGLVWSIGVIILVLMMATNTNVWPNWEYEFTAYSSSTDLFGSILPFNKSRTKSFLRIGPHNKNILEIIICGMLGDFWADKIPGKQLDSIRFNIEQGINNSAYIHHLALSIYELGYSARPIPKLVEKSGPLNIKRFNYRLTFLTFTNFLWIYDSFYKSVDGVRLKCVPFWIDEYLTPLGLAHWIMQDGSRQHGQGLNIATNSFKYNECEYLAKILTKKYKFKTSVVKTGVPNQWRISIWKESMPLLVQTVQPYFYPEMQYKLARFL